jgi:hypothetical protein
LIGEKEKKLNKITSINSQANNVNEKLRVLANTDNYLERYEHILKEREDE